MPADAAVMPQQAPPLQLCLRADPLAVRHTLARVMADPLLARLDPDLRDRAQAHEAALAAYFSRDFAAAHAMWCALAAQSPCVLHELWLARAAALRQLPPGPDWDGVWTHETK